MQKTRDEPATWRTLLGRKQPALAVAHTHAAEAFGSGGGEPATTRQTSASLALWGCPWPTWRRVRAPRRHLASARENGAAKSCEINSGRVFLRLFVSCLSQHQRRTPGSPAASAVTSPHPGVAPAFCACVPPLCAGAEWDATAAAMGGRLARVFRTFNVESRARREISKEKPTPAPRHPTSRLDELTGEGRLHRGGCS